MKWIIWFTVFGAPEPHALGYFKSSQACWQWARMFQHSELIWMGRCMTVEEFEREFPGVAIEGVET